MGSQAPYAPYSERERAAIQAAIEHDAALQQAGRLDITLPEGLIGVALADLSNAEAKLRRAVRRLDWGRGGANP